MTMKQKAMIALGGFILILIVFGTWVYIMIDNVQYAPAPPTPVPKSTEETKVTVEQKSQDEIDKLLNQAQSSSSSSQ